MRDTDFSNMMAMWADADMRQNASLIELVAAAVLSKAKPPTGDEVVSVTIDEPALMAVARNLHFEARYKDGSMTIHMTRLEAKPRGSLISRMLGRK